MSTLAEFGTGEVLWSIVWFTLFFLWIWVLMSVFADIFRSDDLGGWGKALWTLFVVVFVWLGVLVYFIARGKGMQQRQIAAMQAQQAAQADYIRSVAAPAPSASEEIARLASLHDSGALTDEEYAALKAKALA